MLKTGMSQEKQLPPVLPAPSVQCQRINFVLQHPLKPQAEEAPLDQLPPIQMPRAALKTTRQRILVAILPCYCLVEDGVSATLTTESAIVIAWHVIETVLRSLVNSVLVEEEESVARKRGLHSARNPFASAGLQKYLQTNRDLKMTFLGLAAPSLDAAMNPKKEVISIRATED
ncbi:hypothetical protein BIW11_04513, partial [Tropilaelaps mercedesae]